MKCRLTFIGDRGTIYSYIDDYEAMEFGEWEHPFPNEAGNSTAFGLWETIIQSSCCPFYGESIIKIKVEEVE